MPRVNKNGAIRFAGIGKGGLPAFVVNLVHRDKTQGSFSVVEMAYAGEVSISAKLKLASAKSKRVEDEEE